MAALKIGSKEFNELLQGDKPLLVDYWAPWCGDCRRIEGAYEQIAEQYGANLVVAKVNIDEEPELARQENIEVIPTLVLYKEGMALDSIVAPESKARIEGFLSESLN